MTDVDLTQAVRTAAGSVPTVGAVSDPAIDDERPGRLPGGTGRAERRRRSWRRIGMGAAALALSVAVWQVAALIVGDAVTLPTVPQTVQTFARYVTRPYPEVQGKTLLQDA